ncbi:hypothetical protein AMTR_s00078p00180070 [Amborella trichopoda]|uniref:Uncharacterized protein n=1 Tax=Amborella trichopoda TaxID=13333 RepID=W1P220_AMBTC|nr:hypothetical protein AMTR_s00078p00180070 [Amborella trichopoda]
MDFFAPTSSLFSIEICTLPCIFKERLPRRREKGWDLEDFGTSPCFLLICLQICALGFSVLD